MDASMRFCEVCDNATALRSSDEGKAVLVCHYCGHSKELEELVRDSGGSFVVSSSDHSDSTSMYAHYLTPAIFSDPTLPKTRDVACPDACGREVIYIKYDSANMRYLFVCTKCRKAWIPGVMSAVLPADSDDDPRAAEAVAKI
jgi:DNA-directed RNA polymerase subunit M/transcription elongation factor TFIIS